MFYKVTTRTDFPQVLFTYLISTIVGIYRKGEVACDLIMYFSKELRRLKISHVMLNKMNKKKFTKCLGREKRVEKGGSYVHI